jgi:hypothetical protein
MRLIESSTVLSNLAIFVVRCYSAKKKKKKNHPTKQIKQSQTKLENVAEHKDERHADATLRAKRRVGIRDADLRDAELLVAHARQATDKSDLFVRDTMR